MDGSKSFADLVQPGKANRALYVDEGVFRAEMDRIFGAAWLYLGHESQLRRPGDFFTTRMGLDRIIVARHDDGEVYAFHNRCAHRGAEVCPVASGHTSTFSCPYHAWVYKTDGSLASLPLPNGYGHALEERRDDFGLERIARIDSYRGFIFGRKRPGGPDLADFLGPQVRDAFDNLVDRAPGGDLEQAGGKTVQVYRANWKLQIENSIDLLHPRILHANAITHAEKIKREIPAESPIQLEIATTTSNGLNLHEWDDMRIAALPRGHCWMGGFMNEAPGEEVAETAGPPDRPWYGAYRKALAARHGREKADEILSFSRHNTIVYPNLFVNPGLSQIRILHPVAVDRTEQHGYIFRLKDAPDEMFHASVRQITAINSPASIVTTDDHEVFERIQESLVSGAREWVDWSRGLDGERQLNDGVTGSGTNEILMRNQHRAWVDYMTGQA